jgi:hypothetical protein
MKQQIINLIQEIKRLPENEKVEILNEIKIKLHEISPFKNEPVDCVIWVKANDITANDYNPNKVAPPEMELLRHSINHDGYTQPVVTWKGENEIEVVDGFHRTRVCKEFDDVNKRVNGFLPIVFINIECTDRTDRIASTIRHNRARGKHVVQAMSDIVVELKNRNWKNERIARELGMDEDEVLRLLQITGLADMFKNEDFSKSWDIKDSLPDDVFVPLDDLPDEEEKEKYGFRTVNTNDENRIFHTYDKWECFKAGFYNSSFGGLTRDQCEQKYAEFLSDDKKFKAALNNVISKWKNSCEHYLTNASMNRIAYLGQAAMCYATGIPSIYRGGFNLLTEEQQNKANNIALEHLNKWLKKHNMPNVTLEQAMTDRQSTIY